MTSAILAHDLRLTTPRGVVYDGVTLAAEAGDIVAVVGPTASGRTSLLLTLAGRLDPSAGTLAIAGRRITKGLRGVSFRRNVLRRSGLACVPGATDLDDVLTVGEHVGERAALLSPLIGRVPKVDDAFVADVWGCDPIDGAAPAWGPPPSATAPVWQLTDGQQAVLQVRLAMMSDLWLLAVDDLDEIADPGEQARLVAVLTEAAAQGICVIVSTHDSADLSLLDPTAIVYTRAQATVGAGR